MNEEIIFKKWTLILVGEYSMVINLDYKLQSGEIKWSEDVLNHQWKGRGERTRLNQNIILTHKL